MSMALISSARGSPPKANIPLWRAASRSRSWSCPWFPVPDRQCSLHTALSADASCSVNSDLSCCHLKIWKCHENHTVKLIRGYCYKLCPMWRSWARLSWAHGHRSEWWSQQSPWLKAALEEQHRPGLSLLLKLQDFPQSQPHIYDNSLVQHWIFQWILD